MKKVTPSRNLKLAKETLLTLGQVSLAEAEGGIVPTVPATITVGTVDTRRLCEDTWLTV